MGSRGLKGRVRALKKLLSAPNGPSGPEEFLKGPKGLSRVVKGSSGPVQGF